MDKEGSSQILENGVVRVPSEDLPAELTLVSFQRDLLLMPAILRSRFPKLERSRPVRLIGVLKNYLQLTEDEIKVLETKRVLTVASGEFVHILPNTDRLREARGKAQAVIERALNPANIDVRSASEESLVVISYAHQDRAYADLLAGYMRAYSINAWHYVPFLRCGAVLMNPLQEALNNASALAVLMSPHSSTSSAVQQEVQIALAKGLRILPIRLGGRPLPRLERFRHFDATSGELPSEKVLKESLGLL